MKRETEIERDREEAKLCERKVCAKKNLKNISMENVDC